MTQNINLFDPGLRKPRVRLSFALLVKSLALVLGALFALQFFLQYQVRGLNAEYSRLDALLKGERSRVEKLAGQASARKPDPQLEAEIAKLQLELAQAHEAMAALKEGSFGDRRGFAEYLRAFSRQSLDGLWLTAFDISGGGELDIRGRVLRPDLAPAYLQRLNREEVLAGRSFARFEMTRPKLAPEPDKAAARAAPFLEFRLATREAMAAEKAQ